jgi:hypothetical protein
MFTALLHLVEGFAAIGIGLTGVALMRATRLQVNFQPLASGMMTTPSSIYWGLSNRYPAIRTNALITSVCRDSSNCETLCARRMPMW